MDKKKNSMTIAKMCAVALAVVINIIGGQIALMLRLPIYLDSIGTIFVGAVLGPIYGMIPNLLSGIIFGMTTDIYSLYYAPVGIIVGFMAGIAFRGKSTNKFYMLIMALIITVPGTIISSLITAFLFGGITSSGSTIIIQLLSKTPLGLTGACFVVQFFTDYIDRIIGVVVVCYLLKILPKSLMENIRNR